jgi:hypothetical protein
MSRKDELSQIIQDARAERADIELQERERRVLGAVGKYYRHRDSYDHYCGAPSGSWWDYCHVVGTTDDGDLRVWGFRTDSLGVIRITPAAAEAYPVHLRRGDEITRAEFDEAWNDLVKDIVAMRETDG